MLKILDLFSGIGGFSYGLEKTGYFKTTAFCEINPYACAVLRKHWPGVPIYGDVRELTSDQLKADGITVDVISGGFPCQDISAAGKGAGLAGERSGLWSEIARLVGELRPQYVIVENVAILRSRGLSRVLGDLSEIGYDAEWHCIPASAVGAPHQRDRIWIIAYPQHPNADSIGSYRAQKHVNGGCEPADQQECISGSVGEVLAYSSITGLEGHTGDGKDCGEPGRFGTKAGGPVSKGSLFCGGLPKGRWPSEPDVGRVAHGIPNRVDRLKCLGNAVVPQIPEMIGHAIIQQLKQTDA